MKKTDKAKETVLIGKVGSPVGIRGEVRITLHAQDSDNLKEGKVLLLERAPKKPAKSEGAGEAGKTSASAAPHAEAFETRIAHVRYQKDRPVVKLEGIDDRNAAEEIRNMEVSIYADDLEELPEGEHYVRDLIGCRVVDIAPAADGEGSGCEIGILRDVLQNTAQSILEVETTEGKTVLIPAVDAFLRSIDEEAGVIEVELIPGFLD